MNPIGIYGPAGLPVNQKVQESKESTSGSFGQVLKQAVSSVDQMGEKADRAIVDMLAGKADVAKTMIELQKFDISMKTLVSFRNKAIEAYQEVSRMQF
jgi:flagellar hook-basal body complex protein FliE